MMSNLYFDKFPIIQHGAFIAKNIVAKLSLVDSVKQNTTIFFPYTIKEGERADNIASIYYDDPELYWLIYLVNDIVDPYHDWPKDQNTLDSFIAEKYNSVAEAQERILKYTVNWYGDDREISTAAYEALSSELKKYWSPNISPANAVLSYRRKALDWELSTNQVWELTVLDNSSFEVGERVYTDDGEATIANKHSSTILSVQHITGTFMTGTLRSKTTSASTSLLSSNQVYVGISALEQSYWSPLYAYEYELKLNERKRNIRIMSRDFVDQVIKEMTDLLK
jgi:hypothetical protein